MAAIPRKTQKIFGSGLTPSGNVAIWGSLAAGAPAYSGDLAAIQSAEWLQGFNGALVGNRSPALEDMNALMLLVTQQLAYLLQAGVPQWDTGTTYFIDGFARVGTQIYVSLTDDNLGNNPASDIVNWAPYTEKAKGPAVAAAWVVFDGINESSPGSGDARIIEAFNVASVTRNTGGTGRYTINFDEALASANYAVSGTCGVEDGQTPTAADSGIVITSLVGVLGVRSDVACRVFTVDMALAGVESGCVSVMFFTR